MNRLSIAIIILFLTSGLYAKSVIKNSEIHNLLTEQQQIAKMFSNYYKKSQENNKEATRKMKTCISTFDKNQNKLSRHKQNSKLIKLKLISIAKKWDVGHKLSKVDKHQDMLSETMSKIGKEINELRKLYSKAY